MENELDEFGIGGGKFDEDGMEFENGKGNGGPYNEEFDEREEGKGSRREEDEDEDEGRAGSAGADRSGGHYSTVQ